MKNVFAVAVLSLTVGGARAVPPEPITKEATIPASVDEVWKAWTTSEGAMTFFAPQAHIELAIGGPYELYFVSGAPIGSRGSEGCRVLSYLPHEMLSFNWNAPPNLPSVRADRATWVVVRFDAAEGNRTRVRVAHLGWRDRQDYDKARAYFDRAWDVVLQRLAERFEHGPLDWKTLEQRARESKSSTPRR